LADVNSETFLVNVLGRLFPDVVLVGEEGIMVGGALDETTEREICEACLELEKYHMEKVASWEINLPSDIDTKTFSLKDVTVWIDPLDGTRELLRGDREAVTTLLGISVCERPILGVIHQPFTAKRRTVFGGIGCNGVWENNLGEVVGQARPVAPPPATTTAVDTEGGKPKLKVVTTRSHGSQQVQDAIAKLADADGGSRDLESFGVGGAGRKILMLLDGEMDAWVFPSKGTKRWDTCPGETLLEALGGFLVQADSGTRYAYDAAACPLNLTGVVAAVHHYPTLCNAFDWKEHL
jgi:3'(2'), 5'-bisphosphate nucleotidase